MTDMRCPDNTCRGELELKESMHEFIKGVSAEFWRCKKCHYDVITLVNYKQ